MIRRPLLLSAAIFTLAATLLPLGAPPAYACTCGPLTVQEKVDGADMIVTGKVIRLLGRTDASAVFLVQRYLKGSGPEEITVYNPAPGACGFLDEGSLGDAYVLFLPSLTSRKTAWYTDMCSGSTHLAGEQRDQRFLADVVALTGPGALPAASGGGRPPWPKIVLASALGGLAVVAASAYLLRRRIIGRG